MFFRYNFPALVWALFIFVITLLPGKYIPPVSIWDFASFDKLVHTGVFAVLLYLFMKGFTKQYAFSFLRSYTAVTAFSICFFYGFLMETMQGLFLVDRYFDIFDVAANSVGCVLGIFIFKFVT
jgi:VanZ family protein